MGFSKEIKLEIVQTYWIRGGSVTGARSLLQRRYKSKFCKINDRTIARLVKKLEIDSSLIKNTSTGRLKSTLSEKNFIRVKKEDKPEFFSKCFWYMKARRVLPIICI